MTQRIKQINILDMMKMYGEDSCKAVLSTFMCPLNLDLEDFIQNKAVEFARQRIAVTSLVFKENESSSVFVGYYTFANKFPLYADFNFSSSPSPHSPEYKIILFILVISSKSILYFSDIYL